MERKKNDSGYSILLTSVKLHNSLKFKTLKSYNFRYFKTKVTSVVILKAEINKYVMLNIFHLQLPDINHNFIIILINN